MEARVSLRTQARRLDDFYRRGWISADYYVRERDRIAAERWTEGCDWSAETERKVKRWFRQKYASLGRVASEEQTRIERDAAERAQSLQEQARLYQEAIRRYGMVDAQDR